MRVLVACEFSGTVRDAFIRRGHDAMSCDILPTESPGPHYQGDVRNVLAKEWDLIVAHPPCTRITNAGVRWLHERNLWAELDAACEFFRLFLDHPCERIAIENPIPHKYAVERIGRKHDQLIQPSQFGEPETKAVCLWLKGLPPLKPTNVLVPPPKGSDEWKRWNRVHRMPPGPNRSKERSRFFVGIANAFAEQWGNL